MRELFVFTLILRFLSVFKSLGVLLIIISAMMTDLITFMVIFGVITVAFSISLSGLQLSGHFRDVSVHAH